MPNASTVKNIGQLNSAIEAANALSAGVYAITLDDDITLGATALEAIDLQSGVTLHIEGQGYDLNGGGGQRGLFVQAGAVSLDDLTIENAVAVGGVGGAGGSLGGGGGGGAGLGGGLFVASAGNVTLDDVTFSDDAAHGGAGGAGGDAAAPLGSAGGGGGGFDLGGGGGTAGAAGKAGGFGGFGDGGGGGGVDGSGGSSSFGGGGGGDGRFKTISVAGGFGAGAGGISVASAGGGGGGGLGAGGDVFLQQGATLSIVGGSLKEGSATGGGGGAGNSVGGAGEGLGAGIFLQGYQSVTFGADQMAGEVTSVDGDIADQSGAGGAGSVIIAGDGEVSLGGDNTFTGGVTIEGGTLELASANAAGSTAGAIDFAVGAGATLRLDTGVAPPTNAIEDFDATDTIDLADYTAASAPTYVGGVLTYGADTFNVSPTAGFVGETFAAVSDGAGGTDLVLAPSGGAPVLTPASDSGVKGDNITNDTAPSFTVALDPTTVAGDTVDLLLNGGSPTLLDSATVTAAEVAAKSITLNVASGALGADGVKDISASFSNPQGLSSTSAPLALTLVTTPPSVAITTPSATTDLTTVAGTVSDPSDAVQEVSVYDGGSVIGSTTSVAGGAWSLNVVFPDIGANKLTAKATDVAGNTGVSNTVAVDFQPINFDIASGADFDDALAQIDVGGAQSAADTAYSFTFRADTFLQPSADLYAVNLASDDTLTINGDNATIDGGDLFQGLFVYSGAVTVDDLTIQHAKAQGGVGVSGGGGGAGLGGGLFVASAGDVTLDNVSFNDDSAVGGNGGLNNPNIAFGGGGGLGGDGGLGGTKGGGGGGGIGLDALGGAGAGSIFGVAARAGGPGILLGAGSGQQGQSGGNGGTGGGGGGGGGEAIGVPGDGGDGGALLGIGNRRFGGGGGGEGGIGGLGGFGGGGGGGVEGGIGGFGGGGGGGLVNAGNTGIAGFGGGAEGVGRNSGGGGGGLGAGGDIFVQAGATLTLDGGTLANGSVLRGVGAGNAGDGDAFGSGIFLQGGEVITFAPAAGATETISDVIADQGGGEGALTLDGAGTLDLDAQNTFTGGVTVDSGTLELAAAGAAGSGPITLAGDPAIVVDAAALPAGGTLTNPIDGFAAGDTIDLVGLPYVTGATSASIVDANGTLQVTDGANTDTLTLTGVRQTQQFQTFDDGASSHGTLVEEVPCYCRGTRILADRGEVAVENLRVGDLIVTASGALRPVLWIGYRSIDISRHPNPAAVRPVRVAAGAFGEGLPRRNLWLSPGHSVASEGALMPISCLINGRSVAQIEQDTVEYWHVELDAHDVILAEGLPAESYLDCGNRTAFANGGAFVEAHPDFRPKHWAETSLPLMKQEPPVVRTKARLLARLAEQGDCVNHEADAHIVVDGLRVDPIRLSDARLAFVLPAGGREIALRSNTFLPAHTVAESFDTRELGLCVSRLQIDGEAVAINQVEARASARHDVECVDGRFAHRWTHGATPLPAGAQIVIVDLAGVGYYWRALEDTAAAMFG